MLIHFETALKPLSADGWWYRKRNFLRPGILPSDHHIVVSSTKRQERVIGIKTRKILTRNPIQNSGLGYTIMKQRLCTPGTKERRD
ncbi:hypothetical protein WG66_003881 [Moniliophthora roreri]|nr:hypothetical protein WG66_003881 [Moniliophthora roreri]